jgi:hypothetical protein
MQNCCIFAIWKMRSIVFKGGLISESFSPWSFLPKNVPNHYPQLLNLNWKFSGCLRSDKIERTFDILEFSQKTNQQITATNSFVRFLGEFEDTKKSFRNYLTFSDFVRVLKKTTKVKNFLRSSHLYKVSYDYLFVRNLYALGT